MQFDDVSLRSIPVKIAHQKYVLEEGTGVVCSKYRSAAAGAMRFATSGDSDKPTLAGMSDIGELEPLLVSLCLFRVNLATGERSPVTLDWVKSLPGRIVKQLYDAAAEMSGLVEKKPETKDGNEGKDKDPTPGK
jgi:hypothetical protein